MKINSLDEAMDLLQRGTPISELTNPDGEEISIDSILDDSTEFITDSELAFYLSTVISEIGYTKSEVIEKAGLSDIGGFQIFSGIMHPTFNTLIRICLAAGFTLSETQRAIELSGYSQLNENNERDAVIIHAIMYMKDIKEVNQSLYELNQTIL